MQNQERKVEYIKKRNSSNSWVRLNRQSLHKKELDILYDNVPGRSQLDIVRVTNNMRDEPPEPETMINQSMHLMEYNNIFIEETSL